MDIKLPSGARRRRVRRIAYGAVALVAALLVTAGLSRLRPAVPTVERAGVWIDTARHGPLVREVRGLGTLVPEDVRWVPATTEGRVERILVRPGTPVAADTILLELSNPQLELEVQDAAFRLAAAEASLRNLRLQLRHDHLQQQAAAAAVAAEYNRARLQAEANQALARRELVSALALKQSQADAEQLAIRHDIARQQLAGHEESIAARLAMEESAVNQARTIVRLRERQRDDLNVRAGLEGTLQIVSVEVGQQVSPGANLARVANPSRLKAEIKIPEAQARDIQVGQNASIDTRNGVVSGRVVRIDPSVQNGTITVDVAFMGELPRGAVPDSSVDGTIELERLGDVLYIGRPTFSREHSAIGLFKTQPDGNATRVEVKLGRGSVHEMEVLSGLNAGDQVVLSDMTAWDGVDRIRLR
jgi:HlyD family secretion protein